MFIINYCHTGKDDDYLNGGFNPGKRCVNVWDDGCANGQLPGAGIHHIHYLRILYVLFDH